MRKSKRYQLALILSAEPDGNTIGWDRDKPTGQIEARAAVIDTTKTQDCCTDRGDWESFAFVYDSKERGIRDYEDFRFFSWFYRETLSAYGDRPQFNAGSFVDLDDATRYARVLKSIDRKLAKIRKTRGYCVDVVDHLGRVAEAIGADCFTVPTTEEGRMLSGYHNRCLSIGDGLYWLRRRLDELKIETPADVT